MKLPPLTCFRCYCCWCCLSCSCCCSYSCSPATFPTCIIVVANLQQNNVLNPNSNFGDFVRVAAPGTQILSSFPTSNTDTALLDGTSMATPHVAGMATLLFNAFPGATQAQVYNCIVSTATRQAPGNPTVNGQRINGGIVDLQAAYDCLRGRADCPTTGLPACVDPRSGKSHATVASLHSTGVGASQRTSEFSDLCMLTSVVRSSATQRTGTLVVTTKLACLFAACG